MSRTFLAFCVFLASAAVSASAQKSASNAKSQEARNLLNTMLAEGTYDKNVPPSDNGTTVSVNFYVRNIDIVDKLSGELHVQLTLRQQWVDQRLAHDARSPGFKYLSLTNDLDRVWKPDLFVSNELKAKVHDFVTTNAYFRIFPGGEVLFSQRVTLKLSCSMNYRNFPFDKQECSIRMASYGYTSDQIRFVWKQQDPIQVTSDINLETFELRQFLTDYCDAQTNTGIYSCLRADFLFQRGFKHYLRQVFIPFQMLIIIGFLVFFLEPLNIVTRLILTLSMLYVMVAKTESLNHEVPNTSYTKAIDVWTGICLTFALGAVVETVVVNWLARKEEQERTSAGVNADNHELERLAGKGGRLERYWAKRGGTSEKVDFVMRIVYPVAWVLFVIVYFSKY